MFLLVAVVFTFTCCLAASNEAMPEIEEKQTTANQILEVGQFNIMVVHRKFSWKAARSYCKNHGGKLAQPSDAYKNTIYEDVLRYNNINAYPVWIGLNDISTEDTLVWSDDTAATFTAKWLGGKSRNSNKNDCVFTKTTKQGQVFKWAFLKCNRKNNFLCEIPATPTCGSRPIATDRIVGGTDAALGSWPWQVALDILYEGDVYGCGGVVIDEHWILTAAHCIYIEDAMLTPGDFGVRIGLLSRAGPYGAKPEEYSAPVTYTAIHPLYDWDLNNYDFGLLYVDSPIPYSYYIQPACLPPLDDDCFFDPVGRECVITGWGLLTENGTASYEVLQEATVETLNQDSCEISYDEWLYDSMLCAGTPGEGIDACQGDSGGPLVCQMNDGMWYLAGLTSWGEGCARDYYPGVYSRVTSGNEWIQNTIAEGPTMCGTRPLAANRIVGGTDADSGAWPWQVLVQSEFGEVICGGVILDEYWVITAAHCVLYGADPVIYVYAGSNSYLGMLADKTSKLSLSNIYVHDKYDDVTYEWDMALLQLSSPLPFSDVIRPACLATADTDAFFNAGEECMVTGWGLTGDFDLPDILQQAPMVLQEGSECDKMIGNGDLKYSMLCATYSGNVTGTCYLDNGGPLICKKTDERWYLAGLTSWWGDWCFDPVLPSVFARVTAAHGWIEDVMTNGTLP